MINSNLNLWYFAQIEALFSYDMTYYLGKAYIFLKSNWSLAYSRLVGTRVPNQILLLLQTKSWCFVQTWYLFHIIIPEILSNVWRWEARVRVQDSVSQSLVLG